MSFKDDIWLHGKMSLAGAIYDLFASLQSAVVAKLTFPNRSRISFLSLKGKCHDVFDLFPLKW